MVETRGMIETLDRTAGKTLRDKDLESYYKRFPVTRCSNEDCPERTHGTFSDDVNIPCPQCASRDQTGRVMRYNGHRTALAVDEAEQWQGQKDAPRNWKRKG